MVRRKQEIDVKTWVQYILHLIVQIPELNWGFSQKVDLGLVCFTHIRLGLNFAFKIIKLHGYINNLFLVTNLAALISPLLGRWQTNWRGSQACGSGGSVFIVHLILYMSYIIFCFQPVISFMICKYVVFWKRKTTSLFSPTFSFPRCHFLLFDFLVISMLGVTIGQRRECKEIGVVDKTALWIPSWGCPHEKEDSSRIETTHTIVRGIL